MTQKIQKTENNFLNKYVQKNLIKDKQAFNSDVIEMIKGMAPLFDSLGAEAYYYDYMELAQKINSDIYNSHDGKWFVELPQIKIFIDETKTNYLKSLQNKQMLKAFKGVLEPKELRGLEVGTRTNRIVSKNINTNKNIIVNLPLNLTDVNSQKQCPKCLAHESVEVFYECRKCKTHWQK